MNDFKKFEEICMAKKSIVDANTCGMCDIAKRSPVDPGECVNRVKIPKQYAIYYLQGLVGKDPLDKTKKCMR